MGPAPPEHGTFSAVLTGRLAGVVTGSATLIDGNSVGVPLVVLRLSTGFRAEQLSLMLVAIPMPPGRPEGELHVFSQDGVGPAGLEPGVMAAANIARPGRPATAYAVVDGSFDMREDGDGDLAGSFHIEVAPLRSENFGVADVILTGRFHTRASLPLGTPPGAQRDDVSH